MEDKAVHDWYRFVLSFPPHLARDYLKKFEADKTRTVLDPFCGTGTTVVECKKLGIESFGIEANPLAAFASQVKTDWDVAPKALRKHARRIANDFEARLSADGIDDLSDLPLFERPFNAPMCLRALLEDSVKLLLKGSISPIPLHKTLLLLECLQDQRNSRYYRHEILALAKEFVATIGNLRFGPEVGIGPPKANAPVLSAWIRRVIMIDDDLEEVRPFSGVRSTVYHADSRQPSSVLGPKSVDIVITSPPYPNEKDYSRTTRLESVLLGFIKNKDDLRRAKKGFVRSNTRSVYKADDDHLLVAEFPNIHRLAEQIEQRRLELGKTSGFERLYARVTLLYFGGMARHLSELRRVLRPGARLAYVVGDQASYFQVMIRTG